MSASSSSNSFPYARPSSQSASEQQIVNHVTVLMLERDEVLNANVDLIFDTVMDNFSNGAEVISWLRRADVNAIGESRVRTGPPTVHRPRLMQTV